MQTKQLCKDERLSLDKISTLPQSILEIILCFLPTKEAARTSILSREWRFKWTKISKLEFSHGRCWDMKCKFFSHLHQILLRLQGPIHELNIYLCEDCKCLEFDQIILYLSKYHTVKKLTVHGLGLFSAFEIPISVFSLHHLTDLYLDSVDLDYRPVFNGFANLRSLFLYNLRISTETLLHLLSNCPSLKSLNLLGELHIGVKDCTIFELFKCLPVLEHLTTCWDIFEWLVVDLVPQELPTSPFHLKYVCFEYICFEDSYGLDFLLILIKYSPNLEKIKLKIEWGHEKCDEKFSIVWENYSDVFLEHLNELYIERFLNTKPEMEFVKFILARSPKLKKVTMLSKEHKLEMLEVLLQAPRASPVRIYV